MTEYFGPDRALASITPGDADSWALHLRERHAPATAGRTIKRARQFFRAAVRRRLIAENPFADLKAPAQKNDTRQRFVTPAEIAAVLAACPDMEWRLIFALARFGGLRTPSETLALTWQDIDWERGRFLVHSCKTEHHEGKDKRSVPLFPELRAILADAFDAAEPGATHVITRYRGKSAADVNWGRMPGGSFGKLA